MTAPPPAGRAVLRGARRLAPGLIALALAAAAVGHALWSGWEQGWTYDEAFHLGWSERFLDSGVSERVSQERFNSKTPIMMPGVLARKALRAAGVSNPRALRLAARAPSAFWLALLLALVYATGRAWLGPGAAAVATGAAALDPNLAAHASLATADMPFTFAALATLVAALRLWTRPTPRAAALFGAALGLAFVAKVSAFLLVPGVALVPLAAPSARHAAPWPRRAALLALSAAAAWVVVCGAYGFREMARPLATIRPRSAAFVAAAGALPGLPLPVPAAFVTAFDASLGSERRDWNVVVLGRRHPHGVWYYFLVLWALKTPLLLLAAQVLGTARAVWRPEVRAHPLVRLLGWNLVLTLAYFSLAFRAQIGYRYVLQALPLLFLVAAAGLATLPARRRWTTLAGAVALSALAENAAYLGNPLSFTNVAVQPKRLAYRLLADSNVDWGQNRDRLDGWLAERDWNAVRIDPVHILPGRNVIGLNVLAGTGDFEQHAWVREHLEPRGHLGHTWLWYDVDNDTFNRFLYQARRRAPDALSAELCPASLEYELRPSDSETPFSIHRAPQPDQTSIVCLVVRRDTDFRLRVTEGSIAAGTFVAPGRCRTDAVAEGQEWWWRLDPGTHALCLVAQPNRRAFLPYRMDATMLVHGWSVRLSVRPLTPGPTPPPPAAPSPRSSSPPRPREG
jgi:4-amino-4-deoxy-L-arabinose transferase-like glycosyltransferase